MTTNNALQRASELTAHVAELRNRWSNLDNNLVLIAAAIQTGAPVLVDGKRQTVTPDQAPRVLTLARQGRVITEQMERDRLELETLKPVLAKVDPERVRVLGTVAAHNAAVRDAERLRAELQAAEGELQAAASNAAQAERELAQVLDAANL